MSTDAQGNEIGKLFVGGLHQNTNNDSLKSYFSKFGEVEEAVVMMDHRTNRSRGFGYIKFVDNNVVDAVVQGRPHFVDSKEVDPKHCNINMKGKNRRSLKIFVGGIAPEQSEETVRSFFSQYGTVTDVNLMTDQTKQRHRGFAFVGFEDEAAVKNLIDLHYVNLNGKQVEIKAMEPPTNKNRPPQIGMPPPNQRLNLRGRPGQMGQMQGDMSGMSSGWPSQPQWTGGPGGWGQSQGWNPWTGAQAGTGGWEQNGWSQWSGQQAGAAAGQWDQANQAAVAAAAAAAATPSWAGQQNSWGHAPAAASQWNAAWDSTSVAQNGAAAAATNPWNAAAPQQQAAVAAAGGYSFSQTPASAAAAAGDWRGNINHSFHPYKR